MRRNKLVITLSLGLLVLGAAALQAGVYRWVDDQGRVHYGDKPPTVGAEELEVPVQKPETNATEAKSEEQRALERERLLQRFQEDRDKKREQAKKRAEEKAERKRLCALAKDQLRVYTEATGLYDLDEEGERKVLSFEERERVTREAEQEVKRWCD
jgi:hypothetical protein